MLKKEELGTLNVPWLHMAVEFENKLWAFQIQQPPRPLFATQTLYKHTCKFYRNISVDAVWISFLSRNKFRDISSMQQMRIRFVAKHGSFGILLPNTQPILGYKLANLAVGRLLHPIRGKPDLRRLPLHIARVFSKSLKIKLYFSYESIHVPHYYMYA